MFEPNDGVRRVLAQSLSWNVIDARSEEKALFYVQHKNPSAFVLSVDGSAYELRFVESIRQRRPGLPVIALARTRSRPYLIGLVEQGVDSVLLYPATTSAIEQRIKRLMQKFSCISPLERLLPHFDLSEAQQHYQTLVAKYPNQIIPITRFYAKILEDNFYIDEAIVIYEKFSDLNWAKVGFARSLFLENDFRKAKEVIEPVVANAPFFIPALDIKAKVAYRLGETEEAIDAYQKLILLSPFNKQRLQHAVPVLLENGEKNIVEKALVTASSYQLMSSFEDKILVLITDLVSGEDNRQIAQKIMLLEKEARFPYEQGLLWYAKAIRAEKIGKQKTAIDCYKQAIESLLLVETKDYPVNALTMQILLRVLGIKETKRMAFDLLKKMYSAARNFIERDYVCDMINKNKFGALLKIVERAEEIKGILKKVENCVAQKNYNQAFAFLKEALQIMPYHHVLHYNLGVLYAKAAEEGIIDKAEAQKHIREAIAQVRRVEPRYVHLNKLEHALRSIVV